MSDSDLERIKKKFNSLSSKAYWGDDCDVRNDNDFSMESLSLILSTFFGNIST